MINKADVNLTEQSSELIIALSLKKMIYSSVPKIKDESTEALREMLNATKVEIFNLHEKHLKALIDAQKMANKENILNNLKTLSDKRRAYLPKTSSFFKFWSEEQSSGFNFVIIIVPLIIGFFIPIVGIAMLVLLTSTTAIDIIDFYRENVLYWSDAPSIKRNALTTEESTHLINEFGQEDINALTEKPIITKKNSNTLTYASSTLIFIISIIGLAAFLFPPIGIPAVALLVMTIISIAVVVSQAKDANNKRQSELLEIRICEKETSDKIAKIQDSNIDTSSDTIAMSLLGVASTRPICRVKKTDEVIDNDIPEIISSTHDETNNGTEENNKQPRGGNIIPN